MKPLSATFVLFCCLTSCAGAQAGGASNVNALQAPRFEVNRYDAISNQDALRADAEWLKAHPAARVRIEGYSDERGEIAYNLALAQKRADFTRESLLKLGVPESSILSATGWGKLYPVCKEQDESCWQQNRYAGFCTPGVCPFGHENASTAAVNALP
jgi:outer membrane protein OmpA-like peptidoglycan-associated protein